MMKKLLLTTALVSMSATAAFADGAAPMAKDFDTKLGGDFDFQAALRQQDNKYVKIGGADTGEKIGVTANNKSIGFDTAANIYLDARNTTSKGMTYGAHIGVQTTTQANKAYGQKHTNQSYLFMDHKDMGRFEAGSNSDVANAMSITAANTAAATGGVSGDWFKYVVLNNQELDASGNVTTASSLPDSDQFILTSDVSLDSTLFASNTERARKVTYYTPKFNGFQAGLSYAPDVANKGSVATLPSTDLANTGLENAFSAGLAWEGKIQKDHGVKVSLTGVEGKPKYTSSYTGQKLENTRIYSLGGMYTYKDLVNFALSYTDYNKTGMIKPDSTNTVKVKGGNAITAGVGVNVDKFTISLTGMMSEKNKNKAKLYSLGAEYKMAPGLMPYAEITTFDMKQKRTQDSATGVVTDNVTTNNKNKGTAFILGTKVKF